MLKFMTAPCLFTAILLSFCLSAQASSDFSSVRRSSDPHLQEVQVSEPIKEEMTIPNEEYCCPGIYSQLAYLRYNAGRGIGYKEGYTTLGGFLTPTAWLTTVVPFFDLRGHIFNDGKFASNAGIGFKYLRNESSAFGSAIYYDFRQTRRHSYHQIALSLEALGPRWEGRVNGYFPLGEKSHRRTSNGLSSLTFDGIVGHNLLFTTTSVQTKHYEFAMTGVDGEVGLHLIKPREYYTLYLGAGPYYFEGRGHHREHVWGGQVRLEARISPYFTVAICNSNDNHFHNRFQGEVSLNIPFGGKIQKKNASNNISCCSLLAMETRMMQPMKRQEIIVVDRKNRSKTFQSTFLGLNPSGSVIDLLFVNPNVPAGGDGTFEDPFNDLLTAQAASIPEDIFYVYPANNIVTCNPFVLIEAQRLFGSGIPHVIPLRLNTGQIIPFTLDAQSGTTPTITGTGCTAPVIVLNGNNNIVSGFDIVQTTASSVISNQDASNLGNFIPIANLTIENNTINQNAPSADQNGLLLQNISGNNLIVSNTFSVPSASATPAASAINLEEHGATVGNFIIQSNTIPGGWAGSSVTDFNVVYLHTFDQSQLNLSIANNTITNNNGSNQISGLYVFSEDLSNINATVTNNVSNNNGANGMRFASIGSSQLNAIICNNTCSNNDFRGIGLDPNESSEMNVTVCDNITNSNSRGIGFGFPGSKIWTGMSFNGLITGNTANNNNNSLPVRGGIMFDAPAGGPNDVSQLRIIASNNTLLNNNVGFGGCTFLVQNSADSNSCVSLTNNTNDFCYLLQNDSATTSDFQVEPLVGNTGVVNTVNVQSVPAGTCTP